jgi:hypothetical protein
MADRPGGRTALRWGLEPASYQVTARPVGLSSTVANPDRQIESQALSQSQRESGPGRDRRAHHRSHKSYTLTAVRSESGDKGSQCSASRRLRGEPEYQNEDATHAAMRATDQTGS